LTLHRITLSQTTSSPEVILRLRWGSTLPRCGPLSVLSYPPQREENPATPTHTSSNTKGLASLSIKALTVGETRKGSWPRPPNGSGRPRRRPRPSKHYAPSMSKRSATPRRRPFDPAPCASLVNAADLTDFPNREDPEVRRSTSSAGLAARPLSHTTSNALLESLQNLSSPAPCVPTGCSTILYTPRPLKLAKIARPLYIAGGFDE
jgi:hypothetical protein